MVINTTNGVKNYCLSCLERFIGCHSVCEKYKVFNIENDKVKYKRFLNSNSSVTAPRRTRGIGVLSTHKKYV